MQPFQEFLRGRLGELGWTYSDLERASGINNSVISRWFGAAPNRPTPRNLEKLSAALAVSYEDLMRLCGYLPGDGALLPAAPSGPRDPQLGLVTSVWPVIPQGIRDAIELLARSAFSRTDPSRLLPNLTITSTKRLACIVGAGISYCRTALGRAACTSAAAPAWGAG